MKKILFLATTTGYQTRMFGDAAERLGVKLVFATDRCDQLEDPWWDSAIPIRFHQEDASVDAILRAVVHEPPDGVLVVGDRATTIAAAAASRLRLPGNSTQAAAVARDKRLTRDRLRSAGLPVPWYRTLARDEDPAQYATLFSYPVVVKPLTLSGSRGVIRANNAKEFVAAFERVRQLLQSPDVREMSDEAFDRIQVESFIDGEEYAVEGLLNHGRLRVLAIFDKPDPLNGPYFEETIYVTPSRAAEVVQEQIVAAIRAGAAAIGLTQGAIHAECRVNDGGVYILEIAARPIGGLCARALTFVDGHQHDISLEELLLRDALREPTQDWRREQQASGVMMIPIPRGGILRRSEGLEEARAVDCVTAVEITAKVDQRLVPLPEGSSYLGFIFAKAGSAGEVERALRTAHGKLHFVIERGLPVV